MNSSCNNRSFAPEWISRDIGIDFEYMKQIALTMNNFTQDLPDEIIGASTESKLETCSSSFRIIGQLIASENQNR